MTKLISHPPVHVQQFVMAYGVEQDRLRAILPEGFESLRPVIRINAEIVGGKMAYVEFCDCSFRWLTLGGTSGESVGETLPAIPEEVKTVYPKAYFDLDNAAKIPCRQVLGAYVVEFVRE